MLSQYPFQLHPHFFHHPSRSKIVNLTASDNSIQQHLPKAEFNNCIDSLAHVSFAPISSRKCVANFRAAVRHTPFHKSASADKFFLSFVDDSPIYKLSSFVHFCK